ncbi:GNAT family N-acetyltransferase [Streptomyces sp. NPDC090798]|uniref:GNAT family N-acetyltransferase n=1 Tax=Streptomyces sp. NPDC090798 TaxID=3365968 RepID=UPI0037F5CBE4
MTRALSTPPVIVSGSLGDCPQPVLPISGGLLLRPWEEADTPAFLSAYQDGEIRRWHTRRPSSEGQVREWFDAYRQEIGFHRLELDHSTRNHASCRVAAKSGYLLEGTERGAAVHDDGRHDMRLHARIRGD